MLKPRFNTAALPFAIALAALGGCKAQPEKPASETDSAASAVKSVAVIEGARLVLPAVKGNPGAVYFSIANESSGTMAINGVNIDGAQKAEMHQTVGSAMTPVDRIDIAPGTSIAFEPGKLHVMAFDLSADLKPGGTTGVTVVFADGAKATGTAKIEAAGDAAMGGMDHGDAH